MQARISDLYDLSHSIAGDYLAQFEYPWEALAGIKDFILELGSTLPSSEYEQIAEQVWVARDAKVFDSAYLGGPTIIDHEAQVRQCAFVRTSAIVGKGSVAGNSSELKNVIIFDNAEVPHYNYVGDSILGWHAHMGAGAITSNLKSDRSNVVVKANDEQIETSLRKFGAMLGDWVEVGCNSVLNPGTVIGAHSRIYPLSRVRGFVPANHIFKDPDDIVPLS
ncbi:transferase [Atopobium sp. oral taxon 810]|uniref:transferase n=1 Tax=Atopobium sp. oral taxon 810 TaxID=712158 RepID=UPI00039694DB|nr:transferase [Atopobium sp. oral taxon 810]ERI06281.1 bacterial transferase hexapeptide repeat protein [Atopobium sp. oral taxon 810 str. F0209]